MSDTPRTDAEAFYPHDSKHKVCDGDFARQLERELNAANYEFQHLREAYIQLQEGNERQRQRIKRLEEAGDRMRLYCADPDDCFAWDKAKEAKL